MFDYISGHAVITGNAPPTIRCQQHRGRIERCLLINALLPNHLRSLFRVDFEAQCVNQCARWDFLQRMHDCIIRHPNNIFGAAAGDAYTDSTSASNLITAELHKLHAEEQQQRTGRHEDLLKLRTETASAKTKVGQLMRKFEAECQAKLQNRQRAAQQQQHQEQQHKIMPHKSSTADQNNAIYSRPSTTSAQNQKTPVASRHITATPSAASSSSNYYKKQLYPSHLRQQEHSKDSGVALSSSQSYGALLLERTSTPLEEATSNRKPPQNRQQQKVGIAMTPSLTTEYDKFRSRLLHSASAATTATTASSSIATRRSSTVGSSISSYANPMSASRDGGVLKSILKNRKGSGGATSSVSSVQSSAGQFRVLDAIGTMDEWKHTQKRHQAAPVASVLPASAHRTNKRSASITSLSVAERSRDTPYV